MASPPNQCHPSDVTPIRCMPQGKRTPTEKVGFKRMLQNVRPAVVSSRGARRSSPISLRVSLGEFALPWLLRPHPAGALLPLPLLARAPLHPTLAIREHITRALCGRCRTQFEAWCSMQSATEDGLGPAPAAERRCTVVPILQATGGDGVRAHHDVNAALKTCGSPGRSSVTSALTTYRIGGRVAAWTRRSTRSRARM